MCHAYISVYYVNICIFCTYKRVCSSHVHTHVCNIHTHSLVHQSLVQKLKAEIVSLGKKARELDTALLEKGRVEKELNTSNTVVRYVCECERVCVCVCVWGGVCACVSLFFSSVFSCGIYGSLLTRDMGLF